MVVLDTNIVIALFRQEESVLEPIRQGAVIHVPIIVIGELYFGAAKSQRKKENRRRIEQLTEQVTLLYCLDETPKYYAQIKQELQQKGRPIPENDIWIAALAQEYGLPLVSRDRHFNHIDDLSLIQW